MASLAFQSLAGIPSSSLLLARITQYNFQPIDKELQQDLSRLFHRDADTGVTVLEMTSKTILTPDERSSLEILFYFLGKEVADLKSLDADGNPKQWVMKKLDSRKCDFDS